MKGKTENKFCKFEIIYYESGTVMHSLGTADLDNKYIPSHNSYSH